MGEVKQLLNSLLWDIYGKQQQDAHQSSRCNHARSRQHRTAAMTTNATTAVNFGQSRKELQRLSVRKLIDICAILKVEIRLMGYFLERVLISRDRNRRHQEVLCGFVDAILHLEAYNAHPKMRFSLSPPPPKAASAVTSPTNMQARTSGGPKSDDGSAVIKDDDAASDYYQWLHAMKLVARLPGGMPPEFRRKLWLSLADKYLKSKNVDWAKEEEKCFCEKWREDDEELGIQIVKDLHRTGSNLCTGPAGSINQAKLKRILLGYARYSPEVGYCQGFNMLGALILQVMEKEEAESMKVMIYLVEGVLPPGYFCGSMGGLQADMGVFRELMQTKLPRLAKHLQKLQGPGENAYEPPLTNVFTMQWFLTMFCTCLPMSCVLRVWDLVLIEGSDVLLRTALVLWSLLEERVLSARTADDFYCKMGSFSSELLNGHLIDSNGLIEKVVQLGAIPDIQKLRDKHLYNITPLRHNQGLQLYFDDEEPGSDEESQLAVATVWGIPWVRRGSHGQSSNAKQVPENKDRLALDISLLKKQYDRLRERQKQAHIILTTACSTARQGASPQNPIAMPVNQLLLGRSAIVTNKGRRVGPPPGAVPPARKPSLPTVLQTKPPERQLRRGETLHWRDTDLSKRRRDSLTWKEIRADRASLLREGADKAAIKSQKVRSRVGKSDSSSYSEESEDDDDASSTDTSLCDEDDPNSTGDKTHSSSIENSPKRKSKVSRKQKEAVARLQQLTEPGRDADKERQRPKSWAPSSTEIPFTLMTSESPAHSGDEQKTTRLHNYEDLLKEEEDSATESDRVGYKCAADLDWSTTKYSSIAGDLATTQLGPLHVQTDVLELPVITSTSQLSPMADISSYLNNATISPLPTPKPFFLDSTNSLGSGDGDDQRKFNVSDDGVTNEYFERVNSVERPTKLDLFYSLNEEDSIRDAYKDKDDETREVLKTEEDVSKVAVIVSPDFKTVKEKHENKVNVEKLRESCEEDIASVDRRMELLIDYSEKSSAAFIAEATNELSTSLGKEKIKEEENDRLASHIRDDDIPGEAKAHFEENFREAKENANTEHRGKRGPLDKQIALSNSSKKRRDPRRLTLTRSSTIDIEERFQALERRLSSEECAADNLKSQTKAEDVTSKENTHKKIPSTTDLEERFNSLERQFSTGRGENKEIIESSIKKDNSTIAGVMDSAGESPTKPSRNRIPSTADLENRFNAMERQLSSNSLPGRGSINLQNSDDKKCNEDAQTPPNTPAEKSERDLETGDSKADVDADSTGDKAVHAADSGDRPRMRKLPSTAELEDRFNALERKMSIPKTSPSKTKKEPPDGQEKDDSTKVTAGDPVDEPNQTRRISEDNLDKTETSENAAKPKGTSSSEAETPASSRLPEDSETSKTRNKTKEIEVKCTKVKEQGGEIEGVRKKSPPSTEELEKRFQALEKQMSTASFEGEMEPKRKSSQAQREAEILHEEPTTSNATNIKENDSKSHNGEQTKKSLSSFEAKCKAVNEKLADKTAVNAETEKTEHTQQVSSADATAGESTEPEPNTKSIKYFENKCKAINKELTENEEQLQEREVVKHVEENTKEVEREKTQRDLTKRRASEPPSTEDLEKRFESLKRRMSTKAIIEKGFGRPEHSYETTDTRKAYLIEESNEPDDTKSSNSSKDISEIGQKVESKISKEPPSTEDLESRFEALQRQSSPNNARADDLKKARDHVDAPTIDKNEATNPTAEVKPEATRNQSPETSDIKSKEISPTEAKLKADTANVAAIPDAPPMPKAHFADMSPSIGSLVANDQRRALIEEFQSKIKVQPNDENLKPSDINPQRKPPPPHAAVATGQRSSTKVDGTSETHANSAFFRSENYEPWHSQTNKMVRRFSDLPSRADLENRLLFLERQLIRKFYKQRCASDSEVASRQHFVDIPKKPADDELPSTSGNQRAAEELEKRVLALEKQLSENSLKLLEAVRLKAEEGNEENASPRRLSTETIDANGKELVRYTHVGELEEFGSHKPINISINIKMMLNKDGEDKAKKTEAASLPTTAELEKRLEVIEQQLSSSKSEKPVSADQQTVQSAPNEEVEGGNVKRESQPIVMEKVVKDVMNQEFKNDKKDIKQPELHTEEDEKVLKDFQTENLKAEKTLENQQIARSGQAQNSKEDSDFSRVESKNDTEVARQLEQAEKLSMKVNAEKQNEETVEHKTASDRKTVEENQSLKQNTEGSHEVSISKPREQRTASDKDSTVDKGPPHLTANASAENVNELETAKRSESLAERASELKDENKESQLAKTPTKATEQAVPNDQATITTSAIEVGPVDPKNKTLVLLLDNEPKAVKVRRLTRANTEELEGLFQALEKQLSDRNLIKSEGGKLLRASDMPQTANENPSEESKELSKLSKEIEDFAKADKEVEKAKPKPEEEYDWGPDPIKRHLKRKTVHLPSTKELEARFRSLERQIKLLEDVEKIDVEQRLGEIERKIKLQYSLSHEKDLSKFLELCEGKGLEEMPDAIAAYKDKNPQPFEAARDPPATTPTKSQKPRSPYTSPSRTKEKTPYTSPTHASTSRSPKRHMSPARQAADEGRIPSTEDLEYRYRALDLTRSKSKESLNAKSKKDTKQPIHPLEMLLDASPDSSDIPTTGELEHRMRVLDEKRKTPSPPRRARSRSPTIDDLKRQKLAENQRLRTPIHSLETLVASPTKKELPTAEELEARMRALEEEQCFDFKTQKTYKEFNQKLKDVVSPSLSFDEFKPSKSREESPRRVDPPRSTTPKSALREPADGGYYRSTSPKSIRFRDNEEEYRPKSRSEIARSDTERMVGKTDGALQIIEENSKMLHRILKKTLADSSSSISGALAMAAAEGLDAMGSRLMRETSPLQRTGSHTGVPLRTNDNINERLDSIKNTIKSIDSLCEEKPYHKEKCQRYIDSLFSDSIHFASKKTSLEDLTRSDNRGRRDHTPSIRVSDHSQRPLEYYLSRSMGSADSIRSTSPLRAASPLHHRSNRDLRREISPRRRRDEEREEYESRVRRENMLPNYFFDNPSALSSGSITKFHKVDRQLDTDKCDERERSNSRSASRSPLKSPYGSMEMAMLHTNSTANTSNNTATTTATTLTPLITTTMRNNNILDLDIPLSTYRHTSDNLLGYDPLRRSNTTAYTPGKLEIRHTTVTSTFYDRLLAEKEIEKKFSRLPSRSPEISPSATSNSYMDIPGASATNSTKTYNALSPTAIPPPPTTTTTTTTARADSIIGTTGYGIESRFSFGTSVTGSYQLGRSSAYSTVTSASQPNITTTTTTTNSFNSILTTTTTQNSATTPTGNFCAHQNALLSRLPMPTSVTDASNLDLRIRSCDNILMQIKSTSTTVAGLGSVAMTTTTTTTPPPASLTDTPSTLVQNHAITTIAATSAAPMPAANTSNNSNGFTGLNRSTAFTMLNTTSNTSYNFNLTTVGDCTASTATNTAPPPYYTPLTARQPNSDGTPYSFGLYTSTLNNNNNNNTAGVANANAAAELPKL